MLQQEREERGKRGTEGKSPHRSFGVLIANITDNTKWKPAFRVNDNCLLLFHTLIVSHVYRAIHTQHAAYSIQCYQ